MSKYYITTPIYYVNGNPHIGHAYSGIAADVMARWKRLDGAEVFFLTGTDEHGQKVERAAQAAGVSPQDYVDAASAKFRALSSRLNLTNDDFIRTTEPRHIVACQALWRRMVASGAIYLGEYKGWYSVRDEAFFDAEELTTLADGTRRAPTGAPVEWVVEPSYFFRLSSFQARLQALYDSVPDCVLPPGRKREVTSFVEGGLRDFSISRTSFSWGVPVPDDPAHVMYVWVDALTNYLSALGYPDEDADRWAFWPADVHLIGKEIVRFHAVYWPAMLMAADLPVPVTVMAHGWWVADGEKMSKSLGNAVDADRLIDTYGLDAVRFFLLREVPFGNDGDFSDAALIRRLNVELANDLGNLAQRTLSQIAKNCGGSLPALGIRTLEDQALHDAAQALPGLMRPMMDRLVFHDALEAVWRVIRAANAYIDHAAPWALRRTDPARMEAVLAQLADVIRVVAIVLHPFMPGSMDRMLDQLGATGRTLDDVPVAVPGGTLLPAPAGIFPRYVADAA